MFKVGASTPAPLVELAGYKRVLLLYEHFKGDLLLSGGHSLSLSSLLWLPPVAEVGISISVARMVCMVGMVGSQARPV